MKKDIFKKETKKRDLKWYSFDDVFKKASGKKEFKASHNTEWVRLSLAKQIRELRALQKLTQKVVAQKAGMPQSVIARIESGDKGISLDTLGRIAHAFGKKIHLV